MSSPLSLPMPEAKLPSAAEGAPGPFISGSVHKPFRLGQRLSAADLADDTESGDGPVTIGRKFGGTHAAARRQTLAGSGGPGAGSGVRGGASLWDLVEAGVLVPGRGRISVAYKGVTITANLTDDGCIEYQGRKYQSATAFSIHFKRTITPSKQGDDGWKSVLYDGKPLEHYRHVHSAQLRQRVMSAAKLEDAQEEAPGSTLTAAQPPAVPAAQKAPAEPAAADAPPLKALAEASPTEEPASAKSAPKSAAPRSRSKPAGARSDEPPRSKRKSAASQPDGGMPAAASGGQAAVTQRAKPASRSKRQAGSESGGTKRKAAAAGRPAGAPLTIDGQIVVELEPGAATGLEPSDHWVQCERCRSWRVVPNESWEAVQADPRDTWYCEDAQWPLKDSHPFTAACKRARR